jgi:hypothetical protein
MKLWKPAVVTALLVSAACGTYLLEMPRDKHGRYVIRNSDTATIMFGRMGHLNNEVTITTTSGKLDRVRCIKADGSMADASPSGTGAGGGGAVGAGGGAAEHVTCPRSHDARGLQLKVDARDQAAATDVIVCLGSCDADDPERFVHVYFEGTGLRSSTSSSASSASGSPSSTGASP